jgi:hypothetical protein
MRDSILTEVQDVLSKIKFRDWQLTAEIQHDKNDPYCFDVLSEWRYPIRITLQYAAEDNDNPGEIIPLLVHASFMQQTLTDRYGGITAFVRDFCWKMIRDAVMHEAAEQFYFSGERPFDPHKHGEPR